MLLSALFNLHKTLERYESFPALTFNFLVSMFYSLTCSLDRKQSRWLSATKLTSNLLFAQIK